LVRPRRCLRWGRRRLRRLGTHRSAERDNERE